MPASDSGTGSETRRDTLGQLFRFGYVGAITVVIDFTLYRLLTSAGAPIAASKAFSFVVATICAYLLNRTVTFRARGGRREAGRFVVLYSVALGVNVAVNQLVLATLPDTWGYRVEAAFVVAQATSSTINFLGMRQLVFTNRAQLAPAAVDSDALTTERA